MPRRRYDDDDEGFPDIRQKPGTPSDSFGGAYGPPDSDSESGYSRPGTAGSGESGSADIREFLLVYLKGFREFGVLLRVFRAFGAPKLVEWCHLTPTRLQWLADCQI